MESRNRVGVIIFTKVPEVGLVKTRLRHYLLDEKFAKKLHCAMLKDTILMFKKIHSHIIPILSFYPGEKLSTLEEAVLQPIRTTSPDLIENLQLITQRGTSTGNRFSNTFIHAFNSFDLDLALIIGSDTPHLQPKVIDASIKIMKGKPDIAVLGPSYNGGFYILGVNESYQDIGKIFDTPNELVNLMEFLIRKKKLVHILSEVTDIDTLDDMKTVMSIIQLLSYESSASLDYYLPRFTFDVLKQLDQAIWIEKG
ncbi:MAG: DUF2064 domain-containing protein [Candidatus Hodarchaeales archaeon]|jgi:glycosyltransferase A (GT-A) superfamily protein (DUF2064 family)